eukprot:2953948-Alexandrium_andersonii.AAC.1
MRKLASTPESRSPYHACTVLEREWGQPPFGAAKLTSLKFPFAGVIATACGEGGSSDTPLA